MTAALGAFLIAAATPQPAPPDPCQPGQTCFSASADQLFAAAETLVAQGKLAEAEQLLVALTQDRRPDYRAEARFRLAGLAERQGDRIAAIRWLRALLAEQPDTPRARLELGVLLAADGKAREAMRELARAQESGLPADVARTAGRFSSLLNSTRHRGGSIEFTAGPDSNVNKATSGRFVDTVIAPFELNADARAQSGIGIALGGEGYSRDPIGKAVALLTRAGLRADLFPGKGRFNDVQLVAGTGPEVNARFGRIRPSLTLEQRWFGGRRYSSGIGGAFSWIATPSPSNQVEFNASLVRQSIRANDVLDGTRYAASLTWDRTLGRDTTARLTARGAILDAREQAEGLNQGSVQLIVARDFGLAILFGDAGFTRTRGRGELQLFGTVRDDRRIDLGAGLVARRTFAGFAPLLRLTHSRSASNIAIYDFRRTRLDVGFSRSF